MDTGENKKTRYGIVKSRLTAVPALLLAAFAASSAHGQSQYTFETPDDYLAPAATWTDWQAVLDQHEKEREAIQLCVADEETCTKRLKGLRHVLVKGADLTLEQQVKLVNRYVNRRRYIDDRVRRSSLAGNKFETLTEFLNGGGDCEDFAIAKYFVLREFGVPAEDMRVVVGKERRSTDHHAMLAVNGGDKVWMLENDNRIYRNGNQDMTRFVYAINENGIWDHESEN